MSFPTFPERAWGGIRARLSVPNRAKTQQCYQSIEKAGWVENLYSSLQFNTSVNWGWKAMISDTFSVCFPVDKSPRGKSLFQFDCFCCKINTLNAKLFWLGHHYCRQSLLILRIISRHNPGYWVFCGFDLSQVNNEGRETTTKWL